MIAKPVSISFLFLPAHLVQWLTIPLTTEQEEAEEKDEKRTRPVNASQVFRSERNYFCETLLAPDVLF